MSDKNDLELIQKAKGKAFTIHGATHEQRKACVENAINEQAPPQDCPCCKDKFVSMPQRHFILEELDTLEEWVKEADPWSDDKAHIMALIASIGCNKEIPLIHRYRATALIRNNIDDPIAVTAAK